MATVIYQVFVDRFARGEAPLPDEPERAREEGLTRRAWHLPPEEPPRGRDLYGGDLDGVRARLDHLVALGADAIYLTPIFRAPSNHKYDASDFDAVDEHFGGDAAFDRLVSAMRARGLGLFLDGVFNHVGERHRWARERERFGCFFTGSVWRGYPNLPELDLSHPEVSEALFGDDGVVARWTRRGATGWRLDCANDLGVEGCARAARAARRAGATDGVVGELMAYPAGWTRGGKIGEASGASRGATEQAVPARLPESIDDSRLDGVMNYWLRSAALALARGEAPATQVQAALDRLAAELPLADLLASFSLVSSHDTPRLSTVMGGDPARAKLALALAFAYPGRPMIYYGEEIGMQGGADPANRAGMIWDEARWDRERLALFRRLCALRREEPALLGGRYVPLPQPGTELVAFARVTDRPEDTLVFVGSGADRPRAARLFLPLPWLYDALPLEDLLGAAPTAKMDGGSLSIELPAHGCALYKPVDAHPGGYRFFRRARTIVLD